MQARQREARKKNEILEQESKFLDGCALHSFDHRSPTVWICFTEVGGYRRIYSDQQMAVISDYVENEPSARL
jgi:hypothetical protein